VTTPLPYNKKLPAKKTPCSVLVCFQRKNSAQYKRVLSEADEA